MRRAVRRVDQEPRLAQVADRFRATPMPSVVEPSPHQFRPVRIAFVEAGELLRLEELLLEVGDVQHRSVASHEPDRRRANGRLATGLSVERHARDDALRLLLDGDSRERSHGLGAVAAAPPARTPKPMA